MALHLNYYDLNIINWWDNASYGVYDDLKVHTGATMSIGRGSVTSTSNEQDIRTTRFNKG